MNATPAKWKVFIVVNYFLLITFAIIAGLFAFAFINAGIKKEDLQYAIPISCGVFIILLNSLFNVCIYHKFFPNKIYGRRVSVGYSIQTFFFIISLLSLGVLVVWGFIDEFNHTENDNKGMVLLFVFLFLLILGLFVLACQVRLKNYLKKNHSKRMEELIQTIGSGTH